MRPRASRSARTRSLPASTRTSRSPPVVPILMGIRSPTRGTLTLATPLHRKGSTIRSRCAAGAVMVCMRSPSPAQIARAASLAIASWSKLAVPRTRASSGDGSCAAAGRWRGRASSSKAPTRSRSRSTTAVTVWRGFQRPPPPSSGRCWMVRFSRRRSRCRSPRARCWRASIFSPTRQPCPGHRSKPSAYHLTSHRRTPDRPCNSRPGSGTTAWAKTCWFHLVMHGTTSIRASLPARPGSMRDSMTARG